ncbi:hypothetical protein NW759_017044 [Fusarium solani]|nr:hypothetical protein NW759_017044 [Fusarium solani]
MEGVPPSGKDMILTMLNASDARRALEYIHRASDHPGSLQCTIKGSIGPSQSDETSDNDRFPTVIVVSSVGGGFAALFVLTIAIGVIRALIHPEQYGPRGGQSPQSRTQGVTQAMLDTFPIIRFRNGQDQTHKTSDDIELQPSTKPNTETANALSGSPRKCQYLACSICTEDFVIPEDIRNFTTTDPLRKL